MEANTIFELTLVYSQFISSKQNDSISEGSGEITIGTIEGEKYRKLYVHKQQDAVK